MSTRGPDEETLRAAAKRADDLDTILFQLRLMDDEQLETLSFVAEEILHGDPEAVAGDLDDDD